MTQTRKNWSQQEQEEKAFILKRFWNERVNSPNAALRQACLNNLKKYFLSTRPPNGMSIKDWEEKLNREWADGSAFKDINTFNSYFTHIPSLKSVGYAENLLPQRAFGNGPAHVTATDVNELSQYVADKDYTICSIFGSLNSDEISSCTRGLAATDAVSTQSVTKVLTGVLALRLLEEGIISADTYTTPPLQISDASRKALELLGKFKILEQLTKVSLYQTLTHHAGLGVGEGVNVGDYYSEYLATTESASANKQIYPEMTSLKSFLQFIPNQITTSGAVNDPSSFVYSNSGMILAALSLEHLYNKFAADHPERNLPRLDFDGILTQYVTGPTAARMTCFAASPKNLPINFNPHDQLSAHMIGTPGGGYYSTIGDLHKFAAWLLGKCREENFQRLIINFGQEFCPHPDSHRIEHSGDGPFNSMFFSLNWENGNMVIVANDQRANIASEVGRLINENILMRPDNMRLTHSSSYRNIATALDVPPEQFNPIHENTRTIDITTPAQIHINMELKSLYQEDQADRHSIETLDPRRDAARREKAIAILRTIPNPTKEDFYHIALIFQHGDCENDYRMAHEFAKKSVSIGEVNADRIYESNHFLFASTYDRWQLNQDPPKPQKFGTQYAGKDDEKLGWIKGELIPPHHKYQYNRTAIDRDRASIGLTNIDQQESDWGIKNDSLRPK